MKKGYRGYRSYQYLMPDQDYPYFKLAEEVGRVVPYVVPLAEAEEQRLKQLVDHHLIISLHEHPTVIPENVTQLLDYERAGREATGFAGLAHSCLDAVFDNMMDGTCIIGSKAGWKWQDVIHDMGIRACDIAHQDFLIQGRSVADMYRAKAEG